MYPLILGVIFFGFIIAGVILNTIFLVREVRRNEQQDSFLNAVTHELKTPITSIRLYLETLQKRNVDEAQRHEFYQVMLEDTQRLMGTVESVLRAARVAQKNAPLSRAEIAIGAARAGCRWIWCAPAIIFRAEAVDWAPDGQPDPQLIVYGRSRRALYGSVQRAGQCGEIFADEPSIRVSVVTPDLQHVEIRVHDNGIGIPRGELKRVFRGSIVRSRPQRRR